MNHPIPQPGRYREIETGYGITVLGCTGSEDNDLVYINNPARHPHKRFDVMLGRFWDDYEEVN